MKNDISFFEKNLSFWVIICMIIGTLLGYLMPNFANVLKSLEYANISFVMLVLLWVMIIPMFLKIDFTSLKHSFKNPKGLCLTWFINWLFKPFLMYLVAILFFKYIYNFENYYEFLAGAVLLGVAPCTAMVFVWAKLTRANANYTLIQVASNDLIILFAFVPISSFLLNRSDISISFTTLILSTILYVFLPLFISVFIRHKVIKKKGLEYYEKSFLPSFDRFTMLGLLLTLITIFIFQGQNIINNPILIVLISIVLIIQTFIVFLVGFYLSLKLKLPFNIASASILIGASNFFELAVGVSIALFGLGSFATLVCVVGVLVEVPLMLFLVKIVNINKNRFKD